MKIVNRFVVLLIALFMCFGCVAVGRIPTAEIEVEAEIPVVVLETEPELVLIPEIDVYFIAGAEVDIFFYGGWWWRHHHGHWYRSHIHRGGWVIWASPPAAVIGIPLHDYRHRFHGHPHVPYKEFRGRHPHYKPEMHRPPRHWDKRIEHQRYRERQRIDGIERQQHRERQKIEKQQHRQRQQQQRQQQRIERQQRQQQQRQQRMEQRRQPQRSQPRQQPRIQRQRPSQQHQPQIQRPQPQPRSQPKHQPSQQKQQRRRGEKN